MAKSQAAKGKFVYGKVQRMSRKFANNGIFVREKFISKERLNRNFMSKQKLQVMTKLYCLNAI